MNFLEITDYSLNVDKLVDSILGFNRKSESELEFILGRLMFDLGYEQSIEDYLLTLNEIDRNELTYQYETILNKISRTIGYYYEFPEWCADRLFPDQLDDTVIELTNPMEPSIISQVWLILNSPGDGSYRIPIPSSRGGFDFVDLSVDISIKPQMTTSIGSSFDASLYFKFFFKYVAKRAAVLDHFLSYHFFNSFNGSWKEYQGFLEDILPDFHNPSKLRHWIDNAIYGKYDISNLQGIYKHLAAFLHGKKYLSLTKTQKGNYEQSLNRKLRKIGYNKLNDGFLNEGYRIIESLHNASMFGENGWLNNSKEDLEKNSTDK